MPKERGGQQQQEKRDDRHQDSGTRGAFNLKGRKASRLPVEAPSRQLLEIGGGTF